MIKLIGSSVLIAAISLTALPTTASAQSSDKQKKKIQRLFTKLKKLPNGSSPPPKVRGLAGKLVTLDVKKATKYYRTAILKFQIEVGIKKNARMLQTTFDRVIKKAENKGVIPRSQSNRLQKQVAVIESKVQDPTPTPTPYQGFVSPKELPSFV